MISIRIHLFRQLVLPNNFHYLITVPILSRRSLSLSLMLFCNNDSRFSPSINLTFYPFIRLFFSPRPRSATFCAHAHNAFVSASLFSLGTPVAPIYVLMPCVHNSFMFFFKPLFVWPILTVNSLHLPSLILIIILRPLQITHLCLYLYTQNSFGKLNKHSIHKNNCPFSHILHSTSWLAAASPFCFSFPFQVT